MSGYFLLLQLMTLGKHIKIVGGASEKTRHAKIARANTFRYHTRIVLILQSYAA